MKHLLLTTIAAVLVVGFATTQQPEQPTAEAPDISIHEAAEEGNIEAVKQHLAAGTDVNAKIKGGGTPLHIATHLGHKEIAELLIANGADVNAKQVDGMTPLHRAAHEGYKEIVKLLIAEGADANAKIVWGPNQGSTPLDRAKKLEDYQNSPETKAAKKEVADLLRKHGGKTGEELKAEGK